MNIPPISKYFSEKSDFQCQHGMPYDSECELCKLGVHLIQNEKGHNNGGSTDYYKFEPEWKECADIIEARVMNYNQGNIFKSAFCFNVGRHSGTDDERELNKIIYFTERELQRIKNVEK